VAERVKAEFLQLAGITNTQWQVEAVLDSPGDGNQPLWQQATGLLLLTDGTDESLLGTYTNLKLASPCPAVVELVFSPLTELSHAAAAFTRFAATAAQHLSIDVQGYTVLDHDSCGLNTFLQRMQAVAPASCVKQDRKPIASIALTSL